MQQQQPQQKQQEIPISKEYYLQALNTIFSNNNSNISNQDFNQANSYLISFERSKDAWGICVLILNELDQHNDTIVFQAAKTLKSKLQYDFQQLSQQEIQEFGKNVISIIQKISTQKMQRALRGQFSLILIYVYFHTYKTWPDFIQFMKDNFYQNPDCHAFLYNVYLEMPDEINNNHIVIDEDVRMELFKHLKTDFQQRIIQELAILAQNESDTQKQYYALKCFRNWLEFSYNHQVWNMIENHPLLDLALKSTEDSELQIKAENVICCVLEQIEEPKCHQSLFLKIANSVFGYFDKCVSAIKEDLPEEVDIYLKIFKYFGKKALPDFISNPDQAALKYLQNFLELTELDDIDNCDETSSFWRKFFKILSDIPIEQRQQPLQVYENLIIRVINSCVKKCTLSPQHFQEFNHTKAKNIESLKEAYEIKNRERVSMKSVLNFATQSIGLSLTVKIIADDLLQQTILKWSELAKNQYDNQQEFIKYSCILESQLSCIHESTESSGDGEQIQVRDYILHIIKIILDNISNSTEEVKLIKSSLKYFYSFPHFLMGNQELQAQAFKFLSANLAKKYVNKMAAEGFEKLCIRNDQFVKSNLEDFFQLLQNFSNSDQIVAGLSFAICSDDEYIKKYLVKICLPYASNLKKIMDNTYEYQPGETRIEVLNDQFDKLTLIISNVPKRATGFPHDLIQEIYKEVWPLLQHLMDNERSEKIIEKIARFIKYVMRCLGNDFGMFLQDLFNSVLKNYEKEPISSYLYIIEFTTTVFNENQEYTVYLSESLKKILDISFKFFKQYDCILQAFEEEPNLTEDFFGMLLRIMKYAPDVLLYLDQFLPILELIIQAYQLQHNKAAQTMYMFSEYIYILFFPQNLHKIPQQKQQYYQKLSDNLIQVGPTLLLKYLQAVSEYPPEQVCDYICDGILAQIKAFPQQAQQWFLQGAQQAFNVDVLTQSEKEKFVQLFANVNDEDTTNTEGEVIEFLQLMTQRCQRSYMRQNQ